MSQIQDVRLAQNQVSYIVSALNSIADAMNSNVAAILASAEIEHRTALSNYDAIIKELAKSASKK